MSARKLSLEQPESFSFSKESEKEIKFWLNKYPDVKKASAVIPMLWIAQKQDGWVSEPAMRAIADRLGMPKIRVMEVATFYTMFNLEPAGEHLIQVCGTTPCWLRGADDIKKACLDKIGPKGTVSADGKFSWMEVECLGACANAPMVQISNATSDHYFEDLTGESMAAILDDLATGKSPKPGSQTGRSCSEAEGGSIALTDKSLYDGSLAKPIKLPNAANDTGKKPVPAKTTKPTPAKAVKAAAPAEGKAPKLLKKAEGKPDDLKQISGVGPKLEGLLHELGVFHFHQIASWTADEIAWVDDRLKFKGRIERDGWIEQAKKLGGAA
ncbi:NADH-quinone oxidoreductase subunit NuoE [Hyphobacterium sp.]|uniref:NADH-quinone oxidoreductase subunit NuoE n=1 Tax=Hyphobacterium sp. TaxID=2004662 RepID=UPI003BAAE3BE